MSKSLTRLMFVAAFARLVHVSYLLFIIQFELVILKSFAHNMCIQIKAILNELYQYLI